MRFLIFIFISILCYSSLESQTLRQIKRDPEKKLWIEVPRITSTDSLTYLVSHSMCGVDVPYIYIEKTTDYGNTWKNVYRKDSANCKGVYDNEYIDDILYLEEGTVWAFYKNGMIVESTDYGETWGDEFFPFDTNYVQGGYNYTDGVLSCAVWQDTFALSYDKGKNWTKKIIDFQIDKERYENGQAWAKRTFVYGDTLIVLLQLMQPDDIQISTNSWEHDFQFLYSTDKGDTWSSSQMMANREVSDFKYHEGTIYASTYNLEEKDTVINNRDTAVIFLQSRLYKTTNFGQDYETVLEFYRNLYLRGFHVFANGKGIMYTLGKVFMSDDGFYTWYEVDYENFPDNHDIHPIIHDIAAPSPSKFMLTYGYNFSRIEQGTGINENKRKVDKITAYPNPASTGETVTLAYEVLKAGEYSYSLIDMSGMEYPLTASPSKLGVGANSLSFTVPSDLSSGIYFIAIKFDGNTSALRRIVIAK